MMLENIIISDNAKFEKTKQAILRDGAEKLHVISDFDRTLTKPIVNGRKVMSLISLLRDGNYLSPDYREKAHQLFDHYHAVEIDQNISFEKKKIAMEEWWRKHFSLLIRSGLKKSDLETVAKDPTIQLRENAKNFFKILLEKNIPLIIMSSSGIGEAIGILLKNQNCLFGNMKIVTNSFSWDSYGRAKKINEPIIHGLNKNEASLQYYSFFKDIQERKNVILLGNNPEDIFMADGLHYKNILKIGFLNDDHENNLKHFQKYFDIIITQPGDLKYINNLLEEL